MKILIDVICLLEQIDWTDLERPFQSNCHVANRMSKMGPICVTGGSGFLGGWCVFATVRKGYVVEYDGAKYGEGGASKEAANAASNLNVYVADLLTTGSFDSAVAGCTAVIHVASPFFVGGNEYTMENLLKPALDGTRNVQSCNKPKVKKVVLYCQHCMHVCLRPAQKMKIMSFLRKIGVTRRK